jgi:hypothetical protein
MQSGYGTVSSYGGYCSITHKSRQVQSGYGTVSSQSGYCTIKSQGRQNDTNQYRTSDLGSSASSSDFDQSTEAVNIELIKSFIVNFSSLTSILPIFSNFSMTIYFTI